MEFLATGEQIPLSSQSLAELMQATVTKGASLRLEVKGFSMLPFIRDSDVVTVSPLPASSIGLGRVVAFINPKLAIHRIIGKKNGQYLIKGDNAFNADGLILREKIFGCVSKIERNGRSISFGLGYERLVIALLNKIQLWYATVWIWNRLPSFLRNVLKPII